MYVFWEYAWSVAMTRKEGEMWSTSDIISGGSCCHSRSPVMVKPLAIVQS